MPLESFPATAILAIIYAIRLVREFRLVGRTHAARDGRVSLAFFGVAWALAAMGSWNGVAHQVPHFGFLGVGVSGMIVFHHLRLQIARRTLQGSYGTGMAPHGTLVESGAYRWIRHPVYLCYATEIFFVVLISPSLIGSIGFLLNLGATLWRIPREEAMLRQAYGAGWDNFCQKVRWRLIPRAW